METKPYLKWLKENPLDSKRNSSVTKSTCATYANNLKRKEPTDNSRINPIYIANKLQELLKEQTN